MFIDSHCHLNFPDLQKDLDQILADMEQNRVGVALCVGVDMTKTQEVIALAEKYQHIWATVGVHPADQDTPETTVEELCSLAQHPKVVAFGETGLDYYWHNDPTLLDWQRDRFRTHIRAGIQSQLPIVVHTRNSIEDTLRIMQEEGADRCGAVMHCFAENWFYAQQAIEMGFYISLSGIVTFKNALDVQEVARNTPLDRLLIETDSPYLAPEPYRGKRNDPSKVIYVAQKIAELKGIDVSEVEEVTTENFFNLFQKVED